ncbi:phosphatase PAP2 family protein [Paraburkholderia sp. DD10]|uniref:phosphatase PAP2 family protein n=1 Tax=Paraburkholderia sp. DD10 TaxID=3409691 RepID=UPI003BA260BF
MIDVGHTFIPHVADSSFPSDHLTLWWATVFSVLMQQGPRRAWSALALLGISIAWARIYLGVHFPFDMLGAAVVAALSAWLTLNAAHWYPPPGISTCCRHTSHASQQADQTGMGSRMKQPMTELSQPG